MNHLLTFCRTFGHWLILNLLLCSLLSFGQTTPYGGTFRRNAEDTQLRLGERVLLDAQQDGFMSIKEIIPAPGQAHFLVLACGYECNDNIGFLFRADGRGKRKFTARWDAILQSALEWSADGRQLYYFRINSSGAEAPRHAPTEGWVAMDVRTGAKTAAHTRRLKPTASYAVFNVSSNDVLKVRARADSKSPSIGTLAHDARGVRVTGVTKRAGGSTWVRIQTKDITGWVNQNYLCEEHSTLKVN